jgi:hypothetical protein
MDLYTMECGVKAMKNPTIVFVALLIAYGFSGCGKKAAPPSAANPMETPATAAVVNPMPGQAGPADLPPCPGFVALEDSKGDSQAGSSILLSSQAGENLLEAYTTDLLADGWVMESSIQQGNQHNLQFRQGDRFLRFQLGPSDNPAGVSRLHLAWGQAAGAGDSREAYEPEPEEEAPSDVNAGSREW